MNKFNEEIYITLDFEQACNLFNIKPDQILQEFIDKVCLSKFFADPLGSYRPANTFLMDYAISNNSSGAIAERWYKYTGRLGLVVVHGEDVDTHIQKILDDWHWEMMQERSNDILKDLKGGKK